MVVVLPAPLRPRKPADGAGRHLEGSARGAPRRRRSSCRRSAASMTRPCQLTVTSCSDSVPAASSASNSRRISSSVTPRARAVAPPRRRQSSARPRTCRSSFFRSRVRRDERAGAVAQLDDALVLELAVGLGHGVGIDHELLRQRTDAGQLLARPRARRSRWRASPAPSAGGRWARRTRDWVGTACDRQLCY